ncbi:MAG: hypothetical protein GF400_10595 [Candidatus Eisenbacteria bacterium]|nr:hypothetical protein [Candidatus Eisenbacteria bacterium]
MQYEEQQFCRSCAMPINEPNLEQMSEAYCEHCMNDEGTLKSRDEVKAGIARWIMAWQHVDEETAMKRAEHYMHAMPAWAEGK